jgi:hypothetical protein
MSETTGQRIAREWAALELSVGLGNLAARIDEALATVTAERDVLRAECAAAWALPRMCRDGHDAVGFGGDEERCPVCRERDAARAEMAKLRALLDDATTWRPMGTAPRDGTAVLVCATPDQVAVVRWVHHGWLSAAGYMLFSPRGWRPLPAPMPPQEPTP